MNEELLSYIWKHQVFRKENLCTSDAEILHIYHPGILNTDAGPDFFNAKIQVGDIQLAGNIELHVRSSDFLKHKHEQDPAYSSIILHVVYEKDTELVLDCPELELKEFINEKLLSRYDYLRQGQGDIPCSALLDPQHGNWPFWLERLFIERLEDRGAQLESILKSNAYHWEKTFYQFLSRAFGFNVNMLPFEIVGRNIDPIFIHRNAGDITKMEALVFGLAGFLEEKPQDGYQSGLIEEYGRLKHIHDLKHIDASLWKFHRLRPGNFPCIRLSQFAKLLAGRNRLLESILHAERLEDLILLFQVEASEYWKHHSYFSKVSSIQNTAIGKESIQLLLMNAVFPFLAFYARKNHLLGLQERVLAFAHELSPEKNKILRKWTELNLKARNASESQALIQLYKKYCLKRRCLECQMGHVFLKKEEKIAFH